MRIHRIAILCLSGLSAACATAPDPCTPEWVEYKTDQVLSEFASQNRGDVRSLKSFAQTLEDGEVGPLTALKLPGMIEDFKDLANSFETVALPQINLVVEECGTPEELVPVFTKFLRKEGVGDEVVEWVELLGAFIVESDV